MCPRGRDVRHRGRAGARDGGAPRPRPRRGDPEGVRGGRQATGRSARCSSRSATWPRSRCTLSASCSRRSDGAQLRRSGLAAAARSGREELSHPRPRVTMWGTPPRGCPMSNLSRREFLCATAAGTAAMALPASQPRSTRPLGTAKSCIFINMVGGPATSTRSTRSRTRRASIAGRSARSATKVPGMHLSELFPKLATLTDKFSLIRSMHHTAPPIHEAGFQLLNTGRLFRDGPEWPSVGAVVVTPARRAGSVPTVVARLPDGEVDTGIVGRVTGKASGFLRITADHAPSVLEPDLPGDLGSTIVCDCASASRPARVPGSSPSTSSPPSSIRRRGTATPTAGRSAPTSTTSATPSPRRSTPRSPHCSPTSTTAGCSTSTLVVATGEFGRTPQLNSNGGRDHWAGAGRRSSRAAG